MLIFNPLTKKYVVDPHYLSIIPLKKLYDSEKDHHLKEAKLIWLYHMYNPHSPFKDYKRLTKSISIVQATFPKEYIERKQNELTEKLKSANPEEAPTSTSIVFDPEFEPEYEEAIIWYRDNHLRQTPLWAAYLGYKDAMYNLTRIISDPTSTPQSISTASKELDTIPLKMTKMREQAEKDEAITLKVQGDRNIRRGEVLPNSRAKSNTDGTKKTAASPG